MDKKKKKISAARVKRGRKLAKELPRDLKGKFLPAGSKNLFKKRKRRKSAPPRLRTSKRKASKKLPRNPKRRMAKRRASGLRGLDEFPQFMTATVKADSGITTFATIRVSTPIPRLKIQGKRATVLELLWVDWLFPDLTRNLDAGFTDVTIGAQLSIGSTPTVFLEWADARTFAIFELTSQMSGQEAGVAARNFIQPFRYDFQDQTGHGYLLTADAFHFTIATSGTALDVTAQIKLFYRFVDITIEEFVGIVQSNQQQ